MVKLPWKTAWRFLKKLQGITIWSSRYIPRHILKRMKIHTCIKIFMWMIIAVLFLIANRWEKNQMSINWKTDKQNAVHIYWPTYSRYIQLGIYNVRVLVTSHVWIFATPWTVAHKAPLSMSRIREWIAISFSRGSSWPRDWNCFCYLAGGFFFFFFLPPNHLGGTCIPGGSFKYLEHVNFKVPPFHNLSFLASYILGCCCC